MYGHIVNQTGDPMAAVIVESGNEVFTLSDTNGDFALTIQKRHLPATVTFKYVKYFTRKIEVKTCMCADTLQIIMLPGNDDKAYEYSAKFRHHVCGFGIYPSYSYFNASFDRFTELNDTQIRQLNVNSHYIGFGLDAYIHNVYIQLNFGFAPLQTSFSPQYRHLTDSYAVSFNAGYTFSPVRNQTLLISPFIGINHLSYNEYVAPRNRYINLDDYFALGYVDYSALQYTGSLGLKIAVRIASFGHLRKQGIYLAAGAAYNFRINRHPYLFTRATHIHIIDNRCVSNKCPGINHLSNRIKSIAQIRHMQFTKTDYIIYQSNCKIPTAMNLATNFQELPDNT